MKNNLRFILVISVLTFAFNAQSQVISRPDGKTVKTTDIDGIVKKLMDTAGENGPQQQLNDTTTCFYAASLSKSLFAYIVMQLADKGLIDLDKPLYTYLPKPLPEYEDYKDLAGDERWKLRY